MGLRSIPKWGEKHEKTYASLRKPCFRSSKIPNLVFTSFVSMLGPKPEDPSDLSPPDELSQARHQECVFCCLLTLCKASLPASGSFCFAILWLSWVFFFLPFIAVPFCPVLSCRLSLWIPVPTKLFHSGGRVVRSATCTCIHYENKCPWRNCWSSVGEWRAVASKGRECEGTRSA